MSKRLWSERPPARRQKTGSRFCRSLIAARGSQASLSGKSLRMFRRVCCCGALTVRNDLCFGGVPLMTSLPPLPPAGAFAAPAPALPARIGSVFLITLFSAVQTVNHRVVQHECAPRRCAFKPPLPRQRSLQVRFPKPWFFAGPTSGAVCVLLRQQQP